MRRYIFLHFFIEKNALPLKIAVSALAVSASLILQNMLFLETSSLVTLYELSGAAELYASLCLLYFSLQSFFLKRRARRRRDDKRDRMTFALVFSPAALYGAAVMLGLPFNTLSLCTSALSFAAWLASIFLVAAGFSAWKKNPDSMEPPPGDSEQNALLSKRENEVIALILRGLTTQETADALFISVATVKTHLRHIYEKTGVRNRAELARVMGGTGNGLRGRSDNSHIPQ